jgi:hypothetical protein
MILQRIRQIFADHYDLKAADRRADAEWWRKTYPNSKTAQEYAQFADAIARIWEALADAFKDKANRRG